jgi:ATP synthase protein I
MTDRTIQTIRSGARWDEDDEAGQPPFKALTRQEAQALRAQDPSVSPWRVVAVQAAVGVLVTAFVWVVWGERSVALSALYGAAVAVVPGALMARGMTSRFASMNAGTSAVSFMLWEMMKIGVSVVMLVIAPKLVQSLSWPALLVALVLCIKVYWFALLWRGRPK